MALSVFDLFKIGTGCVQEFDRLGATLGLARVDRGLEALGHSRRQQVLQRGAVAGGEGDHDHFVGLAGAVQEVPDIKGRVLGADGVQTGRSGPVQRRRISDNDRFGADRRSARLWRLVLRLSADAATEHGVELIQHHGREHGEDDQFEILHVRPGSGCTQAYIGQAYARVRGLPLHRQGARDSSAPQYCRAHVRAATLPKFRNLIDP